MTTTDPRTAADIVRLQSLLYLAQSDPATYNTVRNRTIKAEPPGKAPPTTIPNTWKMVFGYLGPSGAKASNVLWGKASTFTGAQTQLDTVASIMELSYTQSTSLITMLSKTWFLETVTAYDNSGGNNFSTTTAHQAGQYGGTTPNPLPPNVAAVLSWDTEEKYKGGKPRTYFPGIESVALATPGGIDWSQAFRDALAAAALAFIRDLIQTLTGSFPGAQVGTLHRAKNGAWLTPPTFAGYSETSRVHLRVDSQRRRLGKEIPGT